MEPEVLGGVQGGEPDGRDRVDAFGDEHPEHVVDAAPVQEVGGVAVVGAERDPAPGARRERREEREEVLGVRGFAEEDPEPAAELFRGLFRRGAFVVRAGTGCDVGVQRLAADARRMAVDHASAERAELREDPGVSVDRAGKVHDLCETQHARVVERGELVRAEHGSGRPHVGRRHA